MKKAKDTKGKQMEFDILSKEIIGCAIEVHKNLGPGLLESVYEQCLAYELKTKGIKFKIQYPLPVKYKTIQLACGYRLDFFVENKIILELKSIEGIKKIHEAQNLTYMKLSNIKIGLLLNFNVKKMKEGISRFVL